MDFQDGNCAIKFGSLKGLERLKNIREDNKNDCKYDFDLDSLEEEFQDKSLVEKRDQKSAEFMQASLKSVVEKEPPAYKEQKPNTYDKTMIAEINNVLLKLQKGVIFDVENGKLIYKLEPTAPPAPICTQVYNAEHKTVGKNNMFYNELKDIWIVKKEIAGSFKITRGDLEKILITHRSDINLMEIQEEIKKSEYDVEIFLDILSLDKGRKGVCQAAKIAKKR